MLPEDEMSIVQVCNMDWSALYKMDSPVNLNTLQRFKDFLAALEIPTLSPPILWSESKIKVDGL